MEIELEMLKQEILRLKKEKEVKFHCKVSEKGAISIYGLQRFPVTLYKEQWEKIFEKKDEIQAFMEENKDRLAKKEL